MNHRDARLAQTSEDLDALCASTHFVAKRLYNLERVLGHDLSKVVMEMRRIRDAVQEMVGQ